MQRIESWDEYFMRSAYLIASKSHDPKTRIGSVLVRDKNIISTGYNSFPRKVKDLSQRYEDRELKNRMVCHSEENCILTAARLGVNTSNTVLYTFGIPCANCAKALIQGGVLGIIIHSQWPNLTYSPAWVKSIELSKLMFHEAGIYIDNFNQILGIKGFLDGKEIDV